MDPMRDGDGTGPATPGLSDELRQLLLATQTGEMETLARALLPGTDGELAAETSAGAEYLLIVCAGVTCAVPLTDLREVLPAVPHSIYLPASPDWMLGIFPLRNEILGLVDPSPWLFPEAARAASASTADGTGPGTQGGHLTPGRAPATALVVGSGERSLAWAVQAVGDIVRAPEDALQMAHPAVPPALRVPERYLAGYYALADVEPLVVMLRAEVLLADLLSALEEGSGEWHG
jgi:chemotaxis signal transduction protein